jgi:hypothetical protein
MDTKEASDLIDEIFLYTDEPVWVPQYNFECDGLFRLLHRGLTTNQVRNFIKGFNKGIREKLIAFPGENLGYEVIKELEESLGKRVSTDSACEYEKKAIPHHGAEFDFD